MSARLRFAPLHPHPPLARAWWGPWPRRGTVPWWPRVGHLIRLLGGDTPIDRIDARAVDDYTAARVSADEQASRSTVQATTASARRSICATPTRTASSFTGIARRKSGR